MKHECPVNHASWLDAWGRGLALLCGGREGAKNPSFFFIHRKLAA
jgi:hypothetical protein